MLSVHESNKNILRSLAINCGGSKKLKERRFTTFRRFDFNLLYFQSIIFVYFNSPDDFVDPLTFDGPTAQRVVTVNKSICRTQKVR